MEKTSPIENKHQRFRKKKTTALGKHRLLAEKTNSSAKKKTKHLT